MGAIIAQRDWIRTQPRLPLSSVVSGQPKERIHGRSDRRRLSRSPRLCDSRSIYPNRSLLPPQEPRHACPIGSGKDHREREDNRWFRRDGNFAGGGRSCEEVSADGSSDMAGGSLAILTPSRHMASAIRPT